MCFATLNINKAARWCIPHLCLLHSWQNDNSPQCESTCGGKTEIYETFFTTIKQPFGTSMEWILFPTYLSFFLTFQVLQAQRADKLRLHVCHSSSQTIAQIASVAKYSFVVCVCWQWHAALGAGGGGHVICQTPAELVTGCRAKGIQRGPPWVTRQERNERAELKCHFTKLSGV